MSDEFKQSVESAADSAAYSAQQAGNAIQQGAQEVGASVQKTASEVVDIVSEGAKDVASAASDAAGAASDAASAATNAATESAQKAADAGKSSIDDLAGEFNRVGNQVADSARTIWDSDERKDLQDAIVKTLTSIAAAIEEQFKKLADKDETRKLVGKLEETTDKVVEGVKSSKTAQDAGESILKGLQSAALGIEKWLSQQKDAAPPTTGSTTASTTDTNDGEEITITKSE